MTSQDRINSLNTEQKAAFAAMSKHYTTRTADYLLNSIFECVGITTDSVEQYVADLEPEETDPKGFFQEMVDNEEAMLTTHNGQQYILTFFEFI